MFAHAAAPAIAVLPPTHGFALALPGTISHVPLPTQPDARRYYFFTVALADRRSSALVEHIDHLRDVYRKVGARLPFETLAICILPDHAHAIWQLPPEDGDFSTRWSQIKSGFSRGLDAGPRSRSKLIHRDKGIWQRRFWEHRIRDDQDLERHVDYIHYNPLKHGLVSRVVDWPHSSFHRYVRQGLLPADWGGDATAAGGFGEPLA